MANYGDVALNLPADWDRAKIHNKEFTFTTIGHKDGVADAYLTKEPDARHKFYAVDKFNRNEIAARRTEGYGYVTKDTWTVNEDYWEWNADGIAQRGVELLMAMPAAKFAELEESRRRFKVMKQEREREAEAREAEARGIAVTDERGERLTVRRRR